MGQALAGASMIRNTSRHQVGPVRCAAWRALAGLAALAAAALLAGCATDGEVAATTGGRTLAFESIDGPPRPVFDKLVTQLAADANARALKIVSREGTAHYRIRAYLAAIVTRGKTAIHWVWDVYDADGHRMARLAGEAPAGQSANDAWSDADDRVIGQIADAGMRQLAAFAAGAASPAPAATAAAVETPEPAVATADVRVASVVQSTAAIGAGAR
jgi:hypothetical protein